MTLPHNESYVIASYLVTFIALVIIIASTMIDSRGRQRELKRLEAAGIRRRSEQNAQNSSEESKTS
jgi:heme exporter protein D